MQGLMRQCTALKELCPVLAQALCKVVAAMQGGRQRALFHTKLRWPSSALRSLTHAKDTAACCQLETQPEGSASSMQDLQMHWRTHTGLEDTDHSAALIGEVAHAGDHGGRVGPCAPIAPHQRQHHQEPEGARDAPGTSHSTWACPPHVLLREVLAPQQAHRAGAGRGGAFSGLTSGRVVSLTQWLQPRVPGSPSDYTLCR